MQPSAARGFLYVLFSICIWSGWFVASRFTVQGALGAGDVTELRFLVGGVILLPVVIRRGLALETSGLLGGLVLTLLMGAPYSYLAIFGMQFAPVSHAVTLIYGSMLLCVTLLSLITLKEPTTRLRNLGVACSVGGMVTLIACHATGASLREWQAYALFVICGLMWGLYSVLLRSWKVDALHATALICVWSALLYTPIYLFFAPHHIEWAHAREVAFQSVYQGLLTAVLALIALNRGVTILGVSRAAAILPLVPLIATLLALVFLHEFPSLGEGIGIAAVSVGVLFASGIIPE